MKSFNRLLISLMLGSLLLFTAMTVYFYWQHLQHPVLMNSMHQHKVAADVAEFSPELQAQIADLEKKLQLDDHDAAAWKLLARSYFVLQRYSDAVAAYSQAQQLLPEDPEITRALRELAAIAHEKGHASMELQSGDNMHFADKHALEKLLILEQNLLQRHGDADAWTELAALYHLFADDKKSRQAAEKALSLNNKQQQALSLLATLLIESDEDSEQQQALQLYKQLQQLDANHSDALWYLGLQAFRQQQRTQAMSYWQRLLQQLPADSEAYAAVRSAIAKVELL